ncbi:MAG: copper homeostasis protein CutC [Flavobacteriales bacterium]|nr:copper homeostasis protein CutC [Flavobacteriales bacterium]
MRVAVEVCVTSVAEAVAAADGGADGVEACSWLSCGGITPSSGLVDSIRSEVRIPVRVLIRPGPAGFIYARGEMLALLTDAEIFGGGALGLVTGALRHGGFVEEEVMRAVRRIAPESEITFHRAIDHATDMPSQMEACIGLGVQRILTSGGETSAIQGASMIKKLVDQAAGRIAIAAAGGINAGNVVELIERTGVSEVHFAAQKPSARKGEGPALSSANPGIDFDTEPDAEKIEGVMNALVKAGLR